MPSISAHTLPMAAAGLVLLAITAAPAQAAPKLSSSGAGRLAQVEALLKELVLNPAWAKGEFKDKAAARAEMKEFGKKLVEADKTFSIIGFWDKKTPEAKGVAKALRERKVYFNGVQKKLKNAGGGGGGGGGGGAADESTASRSGQNFIRNMKANFRDLDATHKHCKGDFSAAETRAAQGTHTTIDAGLGFAKMNAGRVKGADRKHPAVALYLERLDGLVACHAAIAARLKILKSARKENKDRYFAFMGDVTDYSRTLKSLADFAEDINDKVRKTQDPQLLQKWKVELEAIHALCLGKYKGVKNDSRYGHSNDRNPEMICKAASLSDKDHQAAGH